MLSLLAGSGPALVTAGGRETSYAELRAAVGHRARDFAPGTLVPVAHRDPGAFLVDALAVLEAGACLLPLDPRGDPDAVCRRVRAGRRMEPGDGLVLSTSGSSGRPKAVVLRLEGVLANVAAIRAYLPGEGRIAVVLPFAYSYALVGQALTTLAAGGTVLLLAGLPIPEQVAAIRRLGATGLSSVPASLRLLAEAAEGAPPLDWVASAGGPMTPETAAAMARLAPLRFNQYGLTEASPRVTACADDEPPFHAGAVGRPIAGVEVRVVDDEVRVRGPSVMRAYLDDPEATARSLAGRWLRTGDRGHLVDGYLYVPGRLDDLVTVAGERVGLDEVAAGLRALPGVRDAGVVALPDPRTDLRLVAGVVLDEGATVPGLRRALRDWHPARRPRLVALEALPTNARGKLDRATLEEKLR